MAIPTCKVTRVMATMPDEEKQAFNKLLHSDVGVESISALLKDFNIHIGYQSIRRHKKHICSCRGEDAF